MNEKLGGFKLVTLSSACIELIEILKGDSTLLHQSILLQILDEIRGRKDNETTSIGNILYLNDCFILKYDGIAYVQKPAPMVNI